MGGTVRVGVLQATNPGPGVKEASGLGLGNGAAVGEAFNAAAEVSVRLDCCLGGTSCETRDVGKPRLVRRVVGDGGTWWGTRADIDE